MNEVGIDKTVLGRLKPVIVKQLQYSYDHNLKCNNHGFPFYFHYFELFHLIK